MDVILRVPGKDEPGYLRRMIALAEVQDAMRVDQGTHGEISANSLMKMIDFLEPFVEVDGDAKEVLLDLSEEEYMAMMDAFSSDPVPKENGSLSNEPTQED